jgi:hypothetical protein
MSGGLWLRPSIDETHSHRRRLCESTHDNLESDGALGLDGVNTPGVCMMRMSLAFAMIDEGETSHPGGPASESISSLPRAAKTQRSATKQQRKRPTGD